MWKLSQFTVIHNLGERGLPKHNLVFNTWTSKSLIVETEQWGRLMDALPMRERPGSDVMFAVQRLAELGIVVTNDLDERGAYAEGFDKQRYHPKRIYPVLAVTTACNIGCTYCYEAGVVGRTMTPAVVDAIARWMEDRIVLDGVRVITPLLFGGEPLLYPKILFALMDGINTVARRHSAACSYQASSNGMLMTDDLAKQLRDRGLVQIQISLDGPKCIHDQRRIGKKGQPSYDQALAGIKSAVTAIPTVTVKINFDRQNRNYIAELYDDLVTEGIADKVNVKLEAVAMQFPDSKVVHKSELVIPPEHEETANAYHELMLEGEARGIKITHDTAHTTPCMMSSHHGVAIGPDGGIVKCISLVGRNEFSVGNVLETGFYDDAEYANQMNVMKRLDDCFEERCPYIPVCAGGCSYESIVRTGRYDLRFCTKQSLKAYHYQKQLMRYRKELEALGMRPLTPGELRGAS